MVLSGAMLRCSSLYRCVFLRDQPRPSKGLHMSALHSNLFNSFVYLFVSREVRDFSKLMFRDKPLRNTLSFN